MKLVQFFLPGKGKRVGLVRGDRVLDVTAPEEGVHAVLDLVEQGKTAAGLVKRAEWLSRRLRRKALDWPGLQRTPSRRAAHLLIPIDPPEVWGAGVTYKRSAELRDEDAAAAKGLKGIYDYVYENPRPELFFKATASRCVGPNAPVLVRSDSQLTAAEPGAGHRPGGPGGHRRLHRVQRRVGLGHRAGESPVPAPVEDLPGLLRAGPVPGDLG